MWLALPQFGERSGDRVSNVVTRPVKARTFAQNVSVERETLSLCVYELDALHIFELGDPNPKLGRG